MEISAEDARQQLEQIDQTKEQIDREIGRTIGAPLFFIWGVIWMLGWLGCHFLVPFGEIDIISSPTLWSILNLIGVAGTILFFTKQGAKMKTKGDWRIGVFWWVLFGYGAIWGYLLQPFDYMQLCAFISTLVMFAYVVVGLFHEPFMLWLGLAVTALTVVCYTFFLPWMFLSLSLFGGGALVASGVYYRLR